MLIVDASTLFRKDRAQNHLEPEHVERILGWYQTFEDVEDHCRIVGRDEIEQEGCNLISND